ncbi:uncharacterized protein LOC112547616 [Pelodiscus sinensis]|uniref:uncharacterized protein LOC112547616 n=1 Tax=Pelodiscus sinensis TaxID=13735 RepID=UPI003F6B7790
MGFSWLRGVSWIGLSSVYGAACGAPVTLSGPFGLQVSAALGSWLESCSEACEEGGTHTPDPELQQAGAGPGELHHANPVVLDRLVGLEAEVKYVSTELRAEKLLWSSRYLELLREQQALRDWFQEWGRSRKPEAKDSLEMQSNAEAPSRAGSDGWCMGDSSWDRQSPSGEQMHPGQPPTRPHCLLRSPPASSCSGRASVSSAPASFDPRPSSAPREVGRSTRLRQAQWHPGTRASVPRWPQDLRLGQRAKVLLQAGGIGVGTIRYLGVFPEQNEFSVGVELEAPEQGAPDGALVGHCCFPCQPGRGVFVPFRKVLMVWD